MSEIMQNEVMKKGSRGGKRTCTCNVQKVTGGMMCYVIIAGSRKHKATKHSWEWGGLDVMHEKGTGGARRFGVTKT